MAKIIHYRKKCIGCGLCAELQPALWRMSKKDGKATLLHAAAKKEVFVLAVSQHDMVQSMETIKICPVHIIKLS
jgi:ferredoxin